MKRRGDVISPIDSTNSIVEMLQQTDSSVEDGETVWVRSTQALYVYRVNSGLVPDGTNIVASLYGNGVWERLSIAPTGASVASTQTAWFIDPAAGNDNFTGTAATNTVGTQVGPLKTYGEMSRRIGWRGVINQTTDVFLLGDLPTTDPLRIIFYFGPLGFMRFHGTRTQVTSGTFTATTAINRATNTPQSVTDTSQATWTTFLGKRVRITSAGPRLNAVAWVAKNLGGNAARVSPFTTYSTTYPPVFNAGAATVTPQVGDTYVVENLSAVPDLVFDYSSTQDPFSNTAQVPISFEDMAFSAPNNNTVGSVGATSTSSCVLFVACDVGNVMPGTGFMTAAACRFGSSAPIQGSFSWSNLFVYSSLITTQPVITLGSLVSLDNDTLVQGTRLRVRRAGVLTIGSAAVFDNGVSQGVIVEGGGALRISTALYGNGNAGVGLQIDAGCAYAHYVTAALAALTITGTAGDFQIGGAAPATGVRIFDDTAGTWTAKVATTWANFQAARPGGFGGFAVNPVNNAGLVQEV
jgi:hypothetical protein